MTLALALALALAAMPAAAIETDPIETCLWDCHGFCTDRCDQSYWTCISQGSDPGGDNIETWTCFSKWRGCMQTCDDVFPQV